MSTVKTITTCTNTGVLLGIVLDFYFLLVRPKQPFNFEGTLAGATFGFLIGVLKAILDKTCCLDTEDELQNTRSMSAR